MTRPHCQEARPRCVAAKFEQRLWRALRLAGLALGISGSVAVVGLPSISPASISPALAQDPATALAKPQQAPNSRVVLTVPDGFVPSKLFAGFQNETLGASFVILEAPRAAFAEMKDGFGADRLASRGIRDATREKLARTGPHVYIRAKQSAGGVTFEKFFVVFPTEDQTVLVSVNVPAEHIQSGRIKPAVIETALASAHTVATANTQDIYQLGYLGSFREAGTLVGTSKVYTRDGQLTPADTSMARAVFVVAPSIDKRAIPDVTAFATRSLSTLSGYADIALDTTRKVQIAGLAGVEVKASAKDTSTGQTMQLVQTLLLGPDGGYYRMIGMAPAAEAETLVPEFRQIAESFKLVE